MIFFVGGVLSSGDLLAFASNVAFQVIRGVEL